jgi:hypothetical protein
MYYTLHGYDPSIYIPMLKELSIGLYTAEFHPKRKKLKYYQKKKRN